MKAATKFQKLYILKQTRNCRFSGNTPCDSWQHLTLRSARRKGMVTERYNNSCCILRVAKCFVCLYVIETSEMFPIFPRPVFKEYSVKVRWLIKRIYCSGRICHWQQKSREKTVDLFGTNRFRTSHCILSNIFVLFVDYFLFFEEFIFKNLLQINRFVKILV